MCFLKNFIVTIINEEEIMLFDRMDEQRAAARQWRLLDDSHIQNVTNTYIAHGYIAEEGRERIASREKEKRWKLSVSRHA